MSDRPAERFKTGGYVFHLLAWDSSARLALYAQKTKEGTLHAYEVHKTRQRAPWHGKYTRVKAGMRLAGNEDFGRYGWTFLTLRAVVKRFPEFKHVLEEHHG